MEFRLLHTDYRAAAQAYCDVDLRSSMRLVKACLENAHSAARQPLAVWATESIENYCWLASFFVACCDEYGYRFEVMPSAFGSAKNLLVTVPTNIPAVSQTPFPRERENVDRIFSDRQYYIRYRTKHAWTKRNPPGWLLREAFKKYGTFHL